MTCLLSGLYFKLIDRFSRINFTRSEYNIAEAFLIDGIRQCLRLQGDASVLDDRIAGNRVLIDSAVVHKDHDTILIRIHFDASTRFCIAQDRIRLSSIVLQRERVIETGNFLGLWVALFSGNRKFSSVAEIKRGPSRRPQRPVRNISLAQVGKNRAVQLQLVLQNRLVDVSAQVEIDMVGRVEQSWLIRRCPIINFPFVLSSKRIADRYRQVSGIAVGAVRIGRCEMDAGFISGSLDFRIPNMRVQSGGTTPWS